jgi:hypothetical protein
MRRIIIQAALSDLNRFDLCASSVCRHAGLQRSEIDGSAERRLHGGNCWCWACAKAPLSLEHK